MKKKYFIILTYLILLFNNNLSSNEENKILKIGLIAPLTGEFAELGNSLLYSSQLALDEIGDENVLLCQETRVTTTKKNLIMRFRILNHKELKLYWVLLIMMILKKLKNLMI